MEHNVPVVVGCRRYLLLRVYCVMVRVQKLVDENENSEGDDSQRVKYFKFLSFYHSWLFKPAFFRRNLSIKNTVIHVEHDYKSRIELER